MYTTAAPPTTYAAVPNQQVTRVAQNVTGRYLKKSALEKLLKRLFPDHDDFNIRVHNI